MRVLVTCPPMLGAMEGLRRYFDDAGVEVFCPEVVQTLSETELIELVPEFDGWIIGDDPATAKVFAAGKAGKLKAAVKWGIGIDNVDFPACAALGIPIANTPQAFGREVADLAMSYVTALARETFVVHAGVTSGRWPKPRGISLADKTLGLVGFGDIGRNVAKRADAADMKVLAYDPYFVAVPELQVEHAEWPDRVDHCDFLVFTCALTPENRHMLSADVLSRAKPGIRIVNVARGPLIDERALADAIRANVVHSVALDVFETEPLPSNSELRSFERSIFGSHNGSNTVDAVVRASERAIDILFRYLGLSRPNA